MKRHISLLLVAIVSSFVAGRPAFAQEHDVQDIAQKLEKVSQGLAGGVANDVGFVTLPGGRRFAIAVFTKSSTTSEADRDGAIAEISRSLYDFYYFAAQDK